MRVFVPEISRASRPDSMFLTKSMVGRERERVPTGLRPLIFFWVVAVVKGKKCDTFVLLLCHVHKKYKSYT